MLLRAGALSLALLLASRLLGVLRETAQAAAFGTSGLADVAVLLVTLPDWLAGVAASGALAYVLLPAWAGRPPAEVAVLQRKVAHVLLIGSILAALGLLIARMPVAALLAGGLTPDLQMQLAQALPWSAAALPAALVAALWATRLQHERDFLGMYGANLVVNLALIAGIAVAGLGVGAATPLPLLGTGLLAAMGLRLLWLRSRLPADPVPMAAAQLPAWPVWCWAVLGAGLPLTLPFVARSVASQGGEGALATFNYAWKLVELPLMLAVQLVASLAFPAIARALADPSRSDVAARSIRSAFALAWMLACAAAVGLLIGAPVLSRLLFGWGRMQAGALDAVAAWGSAAAWGLLPQAVTAVALTVLASRQGLRSPVIAHGAALALLLLAGAAGLHQGVWLMQVLNAGYTLVALVCLAALGPQRALWLPLPSMAWSACAAVLVLLVAWPWRTALASYPWPVGLCGALAAAAAVLGLGVWRNPDLRRALQR